jgi:hypothetical protein
MSDQNYGAVKQSNKPIDPTSGIVRILAIVLAMVFVGSGGGSAFLRYIRHRISHERLAVMRYHGEWSFGEYRECNSVNLREETGKPELDCVGSSPMDTGKVFNVNFSGDLTYDEERPEGVVHYWLCRRDNADASFSCGARENPSTESQTPSGADQTAKPVERELTGPELENLRKRNECEQRFYGKKVYEVDGMSIGPACKQNPDRLPPAMKPGDRRDVFR